MHAVSGQGFGEVSSFCAATSRSHGAATRMIQLHKRPQEGSTCKGAVSFILVRKTAKLRVLSKRDLTSIPLNEAVLTVGVHTLAKPPSWHR